jgi:hypothetical protein
MSDHWLESISWASQGVLAIVAIIAAVAAFLQLRAFKLLELLKLLESTDLRKDRRTVLKEIKGRTDHWWNKHERSEEWEAAASNVCAWYDILALMIKHDHLDRVWSGYGSFFAKYWKRSILDCREALKPYIEYRRDKKQNPHANPEAYRAFTDLADKIQANEGVDLNVPTLPP